MGLYRKCKTLIRPSGREAFLRHGGTPTWQWCLVTFEAVFLLANDSIIRTKAWRWAPAALTWDVVYLARS